MYYRITVSTMYKGCLGGIIMVWSGGCRLMCVFVMDVDFRGRIRVPGCGRKFSI